MNTPRPLKANTENCFYHYELVRRSGKYNMIMDARLASAAANLTMKDYADIVSHYSRYKSAIEAKYGSVDTFMEDFSCKY